MRRKCLYCSGLLSGYKQIKFCSSSCSAKYNNRRRLARSEESKHNTAKIVLEKLGVYGPYTKIYLHNCQVCESLYYKKINKSMVCSKACQATLNSARKLGKPNPKSKYSGKRISRVDYHYYRTLAEFKLKPRDLPKIKGYKLLLKHRMWSIDNKEGVVRDHILSTKNGWLQEIDPMIISHPANCQFLTINENSIKGDKSWITYEELLSRIQSWPS